MVKDSSDNTKNEPSVDDTILDIWELVNKILQHQTLLESWMKGGFLNIAKTRYVMGQHAVGVEQLPAGECQVSARLLVERCPSDADHVDAQAPLPAAFRLREQPADAGDVSGGEPLRWFSALPPGALRDAQKQFRRALEISCDIATMKVQLAALMARLDGCGPTVAALADAVESISVS
ncbi:coiled-coil domain-containing protein 115-like [Pollicipes pollicipes]|uniref:coiled-coil domain-containing protein 115-like n=1 Tax=Pollicipes pollicipes TaxID=41117 RepID=UPI001884CF1C|nr:coiled-coil domain-containing protein 115-like [Pollicipes pollicipes]XP_037070630.1 coiled-coil domain-containing protein 115-like [Pollicipes pollicipes]